MSGDFELQNADAKASEEVAKPEVKKEEFDQQELLQLFDKIIFEGEYNEPQVIKGRLKVTFRTRSTKETTEISKKLDSLSFNLITTLQEQRALLNLAYSMISYDGKDLTRMNPEDRVKFIESLPVFVTSALADALAKFDRKVDAACREAEENF